ncbi:hypothetical protein BC834DRAFT_893668 [Gloeopeniophorella convolvens]|nr:hypothetical protein BC834DRAFT_893668 [Gloeopeniophorella convolvens]
MKRFETETSSYCTTCTLARPLSNMCSARSGLYTALNATPATCAAPHADICAETRVMKPCPPPPAMCSSLRSRLLCTSSHHPRSYAHFRMFRRHERHSGRHACACVHLVHSADAWGVPKLHARMMSFARVSAAPAPLRIRAPAQKSRHSQQSTSPRTRVPARMHLVNVSRTVSRTCSP